MSTFTLNEWNQSDFLLAFIASLVIKNVETIDLNDTNSKSRLCRIYEFLEKEAQKDTGIESYKPVVHAKILFGLGETNFHDELSTELQRLRREGYIWSADGSWFKLKMDQVFAGNIVSRIEVQSRIFLDQIVNAFLEKIPDEA